MGMPSHLKLHGNNISNVASAFFVAYLIAEIPNCECCQGPSNVVDEWSQASLT